MLWVRQQQHGQIVLDGMADDDAALEQVGHLALRGLERHGRFAVNVRRSNAAHGRAIVGHRLHGLDVLVVQHVRVEIDNADAGQRVARAVRTDAHELAVDGHARGHTGAAEAAKAWSQKKASSEQVASWHPCRIHSACRVCIR